MPKIRLSFPAVHSGRLARFFGAALVTLGLALSAASAEEIPQGASFFDDFDSFDESRWGISDGWANGTWQNCQWSKDAMSVSDGYLHLRFRRQPTESRDYICGEIQSRNTYGFGVYEARFHTSRGSGLNAAFFTYIGPHHGKPHDEIDFEVLTRDTSRVSLNTYVGGQPNNGKSVPLPHAADDGFITYSFIWSEEGITWYVDGVKMHTTSAGSPLPTHAQKIYASFWGSDSFPNWMGRFDEPEQELTMTVDWIAFTAQGESCRFPASLLCALE
ncbi:endo-1,3-1,4-beta-glycanase ExoK [Roseovarius azorensis]|uniref:Endo-1,3-1,4-beta-glycanase ExoK n=1 Tax=Roseovarius azorensis TaxID=1287727 RepID=A0A1H7KMJ3_9RHOB|nr:family 16 glycosylhydrolase [Roseovarius azorensis]SEK87754.1 endo-1,3-1,4-beta-glycanase ExoK [Roseovarius azorensis]